MFADGRIDGLGQRLGGRVRKLQHVGHLRALADGLLERVRAVAVLGVQHGLQLGQEGRQAGPAGRRGQLQHRDEPVVVVELRVALVTQQAPGRGQARQQALVGWTPGLLGQ